MPGEKIKRVVLEMSLKPFKRLDEESITAVCQEALQQWFPLWKAAQELSILLWVADGSEILAWQGDLNAKIEWARYIGFCNAQAGVYTGSEISPTRVARLYTEAPPLLTYGDLKRIVTAFKATARERFGVSLKVGATFDPGPEFAHSDFKYRRHPELVVKGTETKIGPVIAELQPTARMKEDPQPYAAFPAGVPADTPLGTFLGKQARSFLATLGFDYLWFSNGFGFTPFAWTLLGQNFDGYAFQGKDYTKAAREILSFWELFREACPDFPVEVRGTNFSMGMDLASDCVPLEEIYARKYIQLPPPNSPWGALNFDFGLEVVGHMSRITELPGEDFSFRYYINDPWFWQNPWFDAYQREPFDIYCPLSITRLDARGRTQQARVFAFLSIDNERGELDERCPREVIPHLFRAMEEEPDQPGLVTWVYPFTEYHSLCRRFPEGPGRVFFGDWFVRSAVNNGLPLNTVVSTRNLREIMANPESLRETILFAPLVADTYLDLLCDHVEAGGRVIFYGPLAGVPARIWRLLNLREASGIEGEVPFRFLITLDLYRRREDWRFRHDPVISGGPLTEVLADPHDKATTIWAIAGQGEKERVYALTRALPEWKGGKIGWVRGSLPFSTQREHGEELRMPRPYPETYLDPTVLPRYLLSAFGYQIRQERESAATLPTLLFITRHDNAWIFFGCQTNLTTLVQLTFPDGAPLLSGTETVVEADRATYTFGRTIHAECRVFVRQERGAVLSCREMPPFPTGKRRRLALEGLQDATLTIYPSRSKLTEFIAENEGEPIRPERIEMVRNKVILRGISGRLEVAW